MSAENSNQNLGLSLESLLESVNAEDNAAHGHTKSASVADNESKVATELQSLLLKQASTNTNASTGDDELMNKQAGETLATQILGMIKQANNVISETDSMVADDAARDELTPVQGKTVTEVAKALTDRAVANGAVASGAQLEEATAEGKVDYENPAVASDLDKQAALDELVASGINFDEAVDLVKQASYEIEDGLDKSAAVHACMGQGYSFDDAVELVKQASEALAQEASGEYTEIEKSAAINDLVGQGYSFDDAVELVKQAAALPAVRQLPAKVVKGLGRKAKIALGIGAGVAAATGAGAAAIHGRTKSDK